MYPRVHESGVVLRVRNQVVCHRLIQMILCSVHCGHSVCPCTGPPACFRPRLAESSCHKTDVPVSPSAARLATFG